MPEALLVLGIGFFIYLYFSGQKNENEALEEYRRKKNKKPQFPTESKRSSRSIKIHTEALSDDSDEVYSMFFDVVGESFKNDDGSDRQKIIQRYVEVDAPAHLKFYAYEGAWACAVYTDSGMTKQIGNIAKSEAPELYDLATSGATIDPRFHSVGKNTKGLYGVNIEVLIDDD